MIIGKNKRARRLVSAPCLFLSFLLVDQFLECRAGLEDREFCGGNLDFLTRLWVASLAGGALGNFECAKMEEHH